MARFAVILVHTTSHAIHVERVLKRADLPVKLIPTPRHLSSDCGSAARIREEDLTRSRQLLDEAGVPFDRIEMLDE